jgi:hypothetical protein
MSDFINATENAQTILHDLAQNSDVALLAETSVEKQARLLVPILSQLENRRRQLIDDNSACPYYQSVLWIPADQDLVKMAVLSGSHLHTPAVVVWIARMHDLGMPFTKHRLVEASFQGTLMPVCQGVSALSPKVQTVASKKCYSSSPSCSTFWLIVL